jgi:hypothetical protein
MYLLCATGCELHPPTALCLPQLEECNASSLAPTALCSDAAAAEASACPVREFQGTRLFQSPLRFPSGLQVWLQATASHATVALVQETNGTAAAWLTEGILVADLLPYLASTSDANLAQRANATLPPCHCGPLAFAVTGVSSSSIVLQASSPEATLLFRQNGSATWASLPFVVQQSTFSVSVGLQPDTCYDVVVLAGLLCQPISVLAERAVRLGQARQSCTVPQPVVPVILPWHPSGRNLSASQPDLILFFRSDTSWRGDEQLLVRINGQEERQLHYMPSTRLGESGVATVTLAAPLPTGRWTMDLLPLGQDGTRPATFSSLVVAESSTISLLTGSVLVKDVFASTANVTWATDASAFSAGIPVQQYAVHLFEVVPGVGPVYLRSQMAFHSAQRTLHHLLLEQLETDTEYVVEVAAANGFLLPCEANLLPKRAVLLPADGTPAAQLPTLACHGSHSTSGNFLYSSAAATENTARFRTDILPLPYNLDVAPLVVSKTNISVVATIALPDEVGPRAAFIVHALQGTTTTRFEVAAEPSAAVGSNGYRFQVSPLVPKAEYRLQVILNNTAGEGFASDPSLAFSTDEGRPSAPAITKTEQGPVSVVVSWSPPVHPNGDIVGYTILFRKAVNLPFERREVGNSVQHELAGLDSGATYEVGVAARTSVGDGEVSELLEVTLLLGDDSSASRGLTPAALGGVTGAVVVVIVALLAFFVIRGRRQKSYNDQLEQQLRTMKLGVEELTVKVRDMFSREFRETIGDNADVEHQFERLEIDRSRLKMGKELGKGAFGVVCLANFRRPDGQEQTVAVKALLDGVSQTELEKFLMEARLMSLLNHENLMELVAVCTKETPFYIVTELMPKVRMMMPWRPKAGMGGGAGAGGYSLRGSGFAHQPMPASCVCCRGI